MALNYPPEDWYSSTKADHTLGDLHWWNGNLYMFAYNASATAAAKGAPAFCNDTDGQMVKNAAKTGDAIAEGAWCAAVPASNYGWLLVMGRADYLLGNTGTAAGESLYAGADIWDTATVGTHHVAGRAFTDDTASVFTGRICCY